MTDITLRQATPDDLKILQKWDNQPHVIAAGIDGEEWQWETELSMVYAWREQLIAELNGRAIGYIQIIDPALEDSHYWGDVADNLRTLDIWIGEPDCLGQGFGTQMMHLALQKCFAKPHVAAVLIDPLKTNVNSHRFYERLGFEFVEERCFDGNECFVYQLRRSSFNRVS